MDSIFGNETNVRTFIWRPGTHQRGTFNILSTCVITLGLCLWTAIHMNVPPLKSGFVSRLLRKSGWVLFGFLAPELVAFAAFQQFREARKLSDEVNQISRELQQGDVHHKGAQPEAQAERAVTVGAVAPQASANPLVRGKTMLFDPEAQKSTSTSELNHTWSMTHSYFAIMGGFSIVFPEKRPELLELLPSSLKADNHQHRLTLTADGVSLMLRHRASDLFANCCRSTIDDKSKASLFAKTLVIFQAFWFCVQCLVRLTQHLGISLLEINVFGHALCTLLTYFIWWYKPQDVLEPEPIKVGKEEIARLVAAMTVTGNFGTRKPESACLTTEGSLPRFVFPVKTDIRTGKSKLVGCPEKEGERDGVWSVESKTTQLEKKRVQVFDLYLEITKPPDPLHTPADAGAQTHADQTAEYSTPKSLHLGDENSGIRFYADPGSARVETVYVEPGWTAPKPLLDLGVYQNDIGRWREALDRLPPEWLNTRRRRPLVVDHAKELPTFQGVGHEWRVCIGFAATGFVYGGLHCLAWNAPFPSGVERLLWRASSVGIASTGVLLALIFTWESSGPFWSDPVEFINKHYPRDWAGGGMPTVSDRKSLADARARRAIRPVFVLMVLVMVVLKMIYDIGIALLVILYCLARLYLVVECFINLFHLPDSVYLLPSWSQYMPHIG